MASYGEGNSGSTGQWPAVLTRLARVMREDPKKSTALIALILLLGGMWAWQLAGAGGGPVRAVAAESKAAALEPSSSIDKWRSQRGARAGAAASFQAWVQDPVPLIVSRNLFSAKLEYFPMDGARAAERPRTAADSGFWEQLAKSVSIQADQEEKKQNLILNLRQQAGQLQLQSTVMGPTPKALINGALVEEGAVVDTFRVVKIEARRIIVEREGIKLEIPMK